MTGIYSVALIQALGRWVQDVEFPAPVEVRGWEVFELREEGDRKPMRWTTASIRATADFEALNNPEAYLRKMQQRTHRRGGSELPPRVLAMYVVQGDESVWIDEEGNLYDYTDDGERIVKINNDN